MSGTRWWTVASSAMVGDGESMMRARSLAGALGFFFVSLASSALLGCGDGGGASEVTVPDDGAAGTDATTSEPVDGGRSGDDGEAMDSAAPDAPGVFDGDANANTDADNTDDASDVDDGEAADAL